MVAKRFFRNRLVSGDKSSRRFGGIGGQTSSPTLVTPDKKYSRTSNNDAVDTSRSPSPSRAAALCPQSVPPGKGGLIYDPAANDVLCGVTGSRSRSHQGNRRFHELVRENRQTYLAKGSKKLDKAIVAANIVRAVRESTPPGRFLKVDAKSGLWMEIGDEKARKKACQALRDDDSAAAATRRERSIPVPAPPLPQKNNNGSNEYHQHSYPPPPPPPFYPEGYPPQMYPPNTPYYYPPSYNYGPNASPHSYYDHNHSTYMGNVPPSQHNGYYPYPYPYPHPHPHPHPHQQQVLHGNDSAEANANTNHKTHIPASTPPPPPKVVQQVSQQDSSMSINSTSTPTTSNTVGGNVDAKTPDQNSNENTSSPASVDPEVLKRLLSSMDREALEQLKEALKSTMESQNNDDSSGASKLASNNDSWERKMLLDIFSRAREVSYKGDGNTNNKPVPTDSIGRQRVDNVEGQGNKPKRHSWLGEMLPDKNNGNNTSPQDQQDNKLSDSQTTIKQSGSGKTPRSWISSKSSIDTKPSEDSHYNNNSNDDNIDNNKNNGEDRVVKEIKIHGVSDSTTNQPVVHVLPPVPPPPPPKPPVPDRARWQKEMYMAKQWRIKKSIDSINSSNNSGDDRNNVSFVRRRHRRDESLTESTVGSSSNGTDESDSGPEPQQFRHHETNMRSIRSINPRISESTRSIISDLSNDFLSLDLQEQWEQQQRDYAEALKQHQEYLAQMRTQTAGR